MPKGNILIVEDEAVVAADLAGKLERAGYRVVDIAADGEEALETAAAQLPDLVLMDIRLAGQIRADVSSEVLRRIENGEMPGWRARSHGSQATVADPREAFSAFQQEFGGNYRYRGESSPSLAEDFMQCVAVEITPLVDLVQRLDGGSMASARQHVENVLGPCLTRTPKSPTPVRG